MKFKIISFLITFGSIQSILAQFSSKLIQLDSSKYMLQVIKYVKPYDSIVFFKRLPYKVFKLRQADINNDGQDEFIVGAIRKTFLDSITRKRINIWKIEDKNIVPFWLGSKMPFPLYDFEIYKSNKDFKFFTIEYESNGLFLLAEYEWHSFGLKFIGHIKRNISLKEAQSFIKTYHD
jgi:hypothetical protein